MTSLNHKLLIKIHPSPDEFDPTELVRSINPDIQVIKTGNISNLIKNCSMMAVYLQTDLSLADFVTSSALRLRITGISLVMESMI